MSTQPPAFPRFIPTLTEVVEPLPLVFGADDLESSDEALIQTLTIQMSELIDRKLTTLGEELIQSLLSDHLKKLTHKLQPELEMIARQTFHRARLFTVGQDKQK
jgi:FKBP-type peptidyl-prolyl cis-trans isomerase (trigger factor)